MAEDKTISRDDLKRKIEGKENFLLVETLPEEKFKQAHLPGALNIPPEQLKQLAPQMLPDKNAEMVLYCSSPT
jgi:rhodanese-related sulfurtransferase